DGRQLIDLDLGPSPLRLIAAALNDADQVVGSALPTRASQALVAFRFDSEHGPRLLPAPPDPGGGAATFPRAGGINAQGEIAGDMSSPGTGGYTHACLWKDGQLTDLGTLGGKTSYSRAINDAGWIVGDSQLAAMERHAFLWREGRMED